MTKRKRGKDPWIKDDDHLAEICDNLPAMFVNGESVAEVCVKLGIAKSTFYLSIDRHELFAEAYAMGKMYSEAWWQKLGRAGAAGKVKIQPAVFIANMNNRFNWGENMRLEHTSPDGSMSPRSYSQEQYSDAQSGLSKELDDLD